MISQSEADKFTDIVCAEDPLLTVHIQRVRDTGTVFYTYDDHPCMSTPFQSADMPADDQAAARKINDWLSHQGG